MKQTDYKLLISNLDKVILECETVTKGFDSQKSVLKWTVEEFLNRCAKAKELQSKTDQILHSDVYHIIGMGNLSVAQHAIFISKIKQLGDSRSKIKVLACQGGTTLPGVPEVSEYKCSLLNNKKLVKSVK